MDSESVAKTADEDGRIGRSCHKPGSYRLTGESTVRLIDLITCVRALVTDNTGRYFAEIETVPIPEPVVNDVQPNARLQDADMA